MTGSTLEAIAKRAAACKHWRWMLGAVSLPDDKGRTWRKVAEGWSQESGKRLRCRVDTDSLAPDLADHATLGCLLALVRDAHRDAYMVVYHDGDGWIVADRDGDEVCRGTSERVVLVSALEDAEWQ